MPLVCYGIYSLIPLVVSCDKWNILILMKSRLSEFYFMSCTFLDSVVAVCDYLKGMEMLSCIFPRILPLLFMLEDHVRDSAIAFFCS